MAASWVEAYSVEWIELFTRIGLEHGKVAVMTNVVHLVDDEPLSELALEILGFDLIFLLEARSLAPPDIGAEREIPFSMLSLSAKYRKVKPPYAHSDLSQQSLGEAKRRRLFPSVRTRKVARRRFVVHPNSGD